MRDDRAQMMLLTAVVLVIGFIALAGMAARLSQLPQDIQQGRDSSFFQEMERVADGVRSVVETLHDPDQPCSPAFLAALEGSLRHLVLVEAGRGYSLQVGNILCEDGDPIEIPLALRSASASLVMDLVVPLPAPAP